MGLVADFATFDHPGARRAGGCAGGRHACRADGGDGGLRGRRHRGLPHARLRRAAAVSVVLRRRGPISLQPIGVLQYPPFPNLTIHRVLAPQGAVRYRL